MNVTKKITLKVFPKIEPQKDSEALDDWDISPDVLSESSIIAPQGSRVARKYVGSRIEVKNNCPSLLSNKVTPDAASREVKKQDDLGLKSKCGKYCSDSNSNNESLKDSIDEPPMSLRSEISNLLQKLIQKKKNLEVPSKSNQMSVPIGMKKSTFKQCRGSVCSNNSEDLKE